MSPQNSGELEHPSVPSIREIVDAYSNIVSHNKEHTSLGALFSAFILSTHSDPESSKDFVITENPEDVSVIDAPQDSGLSTELSQHVVKGDMSAAVQDILHSKLFEHIGIAIRPYGSSLVTRDGEQAASKELVPILSNSAIYGDFLKTLKPEDIASNDVLRKMVDALNRNLIGIIKLAFNRTMVELAAETPIDADSTSVGEDALRTYTEHETEYERLGVEDSKLKNYVKYWGQNVLPEYLKAESGQLLTPTDTQGFGPTAWHQDSGGYPGWEKSIQLVDLFASDARTEPLSQEVRTNLIQSVKVALSELSKILPKDRYDHIKNAEPNLENVLQALAGKDYDSKLLASFSPLSEHSTW